VPAVAVGRLRVVRGGKSVLPDVTLAVRGGTVTGLLGPSGSGKTTLMRAIVGVQRIAAGRVEVLVRERTYGKLERLISMPLARLDLLVGYGIAFAAAAAVQASPPPRSRSGRSART
jgi:ABC-type transporter Mla maintaining outer membrane lipid asymmetry ATPase subunit MlaF